MLARKSLWTNLVLFLVREYSGLLNALDNTIKRIQGAEQLVTENANWLLTQCKTNKRNIIVSPLTLKCFIAETGPILAFYHIWWKTYSSQKKDRQIHNWIPFIPRTWKVILGDLMKSTDILPYKTYQIFFLFVFIYYSIHRNKLWIYKLPIALN